MSCAASSPAAPGQPRLLILSSTATDAAGKTVETNKFQLVGIEALSTDPTTNFTGVRAGVGKFADWRELSAVGTAGKNNYVLTITLNDTLAAILPPLAKGDSLDVTVPMSSGDKMLSFSLQGSGKAVRVMRTCTR